MIQIQLCTVSHHHSSMLQKLQFLLTTSRKMEILYLHKLLFYWKEIFLIMYVFDYSIYIQFLTFTLFVAKNFTSNSTSQASYKYKLEYRELHWLDSLLSCYGSKVIFSNYETIFLQNIMEFLRLLLLEDGSNITKRNVIDDLQKYTRNNVVFNWANIASYEYTFGVRLN